LSNKTRYTMKYTLETLTFKHTKLGRHNDTIILNTPLWDTQMTYEITHTELDTHTQKAVRIPMKERPSATNVATYTTHNTLKTDVIFGRF